MPLASTRSITKASAVYHPRVAQAFASVFEKHLLSREPEHSNANGFESVLDNDIVVSHRWEAIRCWKWDRRAHINVYEAEAL